MMNIAYPQPERQHFWKQPELVHLVDRQSQITKFSESLERIRHQRPITHSLLEWHGSPGIGKTQLIRLFKQICDSKEYAWAEIKFDTPNALDYINDPTKLIEDITKGLIETTQLQTNEIEHRFNELSQCIQIYRSDKSLPSNVISSYMKLERYQLFSTRPQWLDKLRQVILSFIALLNELAKVSTVQRQVQSRRSASSVYVQPLSIFFDETEYAHADVIDWVEEWLITPILHLNFVMIVWTARRPWRWKHPEVRRGIHREQLHVFPFDVTQEQLRTQLTNINVSFGERFTYQQEIYTVTGGHPFVTAIVVSEINNWFNQGREISEKLIADETILLREVYRRFFEHHVFVDLDSNMKRAGELLSMIRMVDKDMLRRILTDHGGDEYNTWTAEKFNALLSNLKQVQLLIWTKVYSIDPVLRKIVRKYYLKCETEMFRMVNYSALNIYRSLLTKQVDNRNLFVIEELYHLASLQQVGEMVDIQQAFEARLREYPQYIMDAWVLDNILERLIDELRNDEELNEVTNGLVEKKWVEQVETFKLSVAKQ